MWDEVVLDLFGSIQGLGTGSCEYGNEPYVYWTVHRLDS